MWCGPRQSSNARRRGRRVGFDELAFETTTASAAIAPSNKIEPHTIPISLSVRERPLDPDESSLDEELPLSLSEDGNIEGAGEDGEDGSADGNVKPAAGFSGSGEEDGGGLAGAGLIGGALGIAPKLPGPTVLPLNRTPHRGQLDCPGSVGPRPSSNPHFEHVHTVSDRPGPKLGPPIPLMPLIP